MDARGTAEHHANADEIARMAAIVREGIEAGAVGFATNRLPLHTSIHGDPVPGTFANEDELLALARAIRATGKGLLQSVPAGAMGEDPSAPLREVELYRRLSLETGCVVTFTLAQIQTDPKHWEGVLAATEKANADGARLVPQVAGRPAGLLMSWETFNPFMSRPAYAELAALPIEERLLRLREPGTRAAILADHRADVSMAMIRNSFDTTFSLDRGPVYEPDPDESLAARAARDGRSAEALAYDLMCGEETEGGGLGFLHVWFSGYKGGSLDDLGAMMQHPQTVLGLADGGAHCSMLCDASMPSYVLEHWVRDRSRGPRIAVEDAVRMLSKEPAELFDLDDRGTLEVGRRADLNVIDLDAIRLYTPEIVRDLPTGAARLVQRGQGFDATVVAGELTWRAGEDTGARPGRLIRSRAH